MLPRQKAATQKCKHEEGKEATHNRAVKSERTRHKSECSEAQKLNWAGKDHFE